LPDVGETELAKAEEPAELPVRTEDSAEREEAGTLMETIGTLLLGSEPC